MIGYTHNMAILSTEKDIQLSEENSISLIIFLGTFSLIPISRPIKYLGIVICRRDLSGCKIIVQPLAFTGKFHEDAEGNI